MQRQKSTTKVAKESVADFEKAMQREMRRMRQSISDVAIKVAMLSETDNCHVPFRRMVVETQKALQQLEQLDYRGDTREAHILLQKVDIQLAGLKELAGIGKVESSVASHAVKRINIPPHELE